MAQNRVSSKFFHVLALFTLASLLLGAGITFSGKVVGVTDGDTITVLHDGKAEKIRLHGIDCPEKDQPFGTKAKKFTSTLAFGQVVTVQAKDIDRYGRTIGIVILPDGRSLNNEIVKAGFAWWYKQYAPNDVDLKGLESEARSNHLGLWQDSTPIPPWEWRKPNHGEAVSARTETHGEAKQSGLKAQTDSQSETVYVTKSGTKYHREGCRYLSNSAIPISLQNAVERYQPCSVCKPPVLPERGR
jgi:endonuclease YncB( thermonuclease family)